MCETHKRHYKKSFYIINIIFLDVQMFNNNSKIKPKDSNFIRVGKKKLNCHMKAKC